MEEDEEWAFRMPLVFSGFLALAVAMSVILDGFDLGVEIPVTAIRKKTGAAG